MSVAYYIVLDREELGFDPFVDGKSVAQEFEKLDALVDGRLSTWISVEELDFDLPEDVELPAVQWFDPAEGIELFRRLRRAVESDASRFVEAGEILADIDDYLSVLAQAAKAGARFHLALDI